MAARSARAWGLFVLRVVVGVIYLMHGYSKVKGGLLAGVNETAVMLEGLQMPQPLIGAWVVVLLEVIGGVGLILGLLTPLWNVLFIAEMLTGIFYVHWARGFFVIGPGQGGFEFNLILIAANLCLLLAGAGALALQGRRRGVHRL